MSDIEDYLDDADYLYWEEEPIDSVAAWADDLAEHVVHSPNWETFDDVFDLDDHGSDWEYQSDDYYGHGGPPPKTDSKPASEPKHHPERKVKSKGRTRPPSQKRSLESLPPVKFKADYHPHSAPIVDHDHLTSVALLKDWKERVALKKEPSGHELDKSLSQPLTAFESTEDPRGKTVERQFLHRIDAVHGQHKNPCNPDGPAIDYTTAEGATPKQPLLPGPESRSKPLLASAHSTSTTNHVSSGTNDHLKRKEREYESEKSLEPRQRKRIVPKWTTLEAETSFAKDGK